MRPLPICSLLYRTANTAIKNRWLKVLPSMNSADQTGFVHHRYLYTNLSKAIQLKFHKQQRRVLCQPTTNA